MSLKGSVGHLGFSSVLGHERFPAVEVLHPGLGFFPFSFLLFFSPPPCNRKEHEPASQPAISSVTPGDQGAGLGCSSSTAWSGCILHPGITLWLWTWDFLASIAWSDACELCKTKHFVPK